MKLAVVFLVTFYLNGQSLRPLDLDNYLNVVASHRDRVLLVNFWASDCRPCIRNIPALMQLARKYKPEGFALMMVSLDSPDHEPAAVKALIANRVPWPHYVKRTTDEREFARGVEQSWRAMQPAVVLYDRKGKKVALFEGETPLSELDSAIQKAAGLN